jgi:hypothetical protein
MELLIPASGNMHPLSPDLMESSALLLSEQTFWVFEEVALSPEGLTFQEEPHAFKIKVQ